jgi:ABC-type Mn2+/Zn2+ transport system ATPase subunit
MTDLALIARDLTVRYGPLVALEKVTLEIPSGSTVAVLGPNGCGKSTLFAAALGLVSPASGSIELTSKRVAFVPQDLAVEPSFPVTVGDVVRMGRWGDLGLLRRPRARDRELCEHAMRALKIDDLADRRLGELSGGQRQRALLAQAMAQDAATLLLDEPFSGVDRPTASIMHRLIDGWRDEGRTVMVSTHDLESAARDYDLVLCLNRRVISFGPASAACREQALSDTFGGQLVRVGDRLVTTEHRHEGAG